MCIITTYNAGCYYLYDKMFVRYVLWLEVLSGRLTGTGVGEQHMVRLIQRYDCEDTQLGISSNVPGSKDSHHTGSCDRQCVERSRQCRFRRWWRCRWRYVRLFRGRCDFKSVTFLSSAIWRFARGLTTRNTTEYTITKFNGSCQERILAPIVRELVCPRNDFSASRCVCSLLWICELTVRELSSNLSDYPQCSWASWELVS